LDPPSRTASAYYRLPASLQNLSLFVAGRRLAKVRFGRAFHDRLAFLRDSDGWGPSRIGAYQDAQIAATVEHAYRETDYYRRIMDDRGLSPDDIRGVSDLPKLPILTKDDIRQHRNRIVARNAKPRRLHTVQTSGSSGVPMRILTPYDGVAFQWAVWWRHRMRFDITRGTRHANFTSTPWVRAGAVHPPHWRWNYAARQAMVPMQQITRRKIKSIVEFLNRQSFRFWVGYPSIIHSLILAAADRGLDFHDGPKVIFTGAEALFDHQRNDVFGMSRR
jgi:phenylacetate-CoA ligase